MFTGGTGVLTHGHFIPVTGKSASGVRKLAVFCGAQEIQARRLKTEARSRRAFDTKLGCPELGVARRRDRRMMTSS